jgi:uncharacterized protein (UPF0333 family)
MTALLLLGAVTFGLLIGTALLAAGLAIGYLLWRDIATVTGAR